MNAQVKEHFIKSYGVDRTIDLLFGVLDAIPVSVFIKNEKLEKIFANKANLDLDERTLEETMGYTDFDIHTAENAAIFAAEDRAVLIEGNVRRNEESKLRKDGSRIDFLTYKNRVAASQDEFLLVGTNTLINELKEREKELAQANAFAQAGRAEIQETLDAVPLGIAIIDPDLNVVAVNKANKRFWNLAPDQKYIGVPYAALLQQNRKDFSAIDDEKWDRVVEHCLEELRLGNVPPREKRGIGEDTFIFSITTLSNGNRLMSCFEINEQKKALKSLAEAGVKAERDFEDMKATMDAMPMGVALLDNNLDILFANKSNARLWNWEPGTIQPGDPFRKMIDVNRHKGMYDVEDSQWEPYVAKRLAEIAAGDIAPREFTRRDGVTIIYSCTALSDGKRLICYFDISEQKAAELAFKDAERKAILADRAKSEFLANMSHEIRTPMNGVLGMAELLARTNLDVKQKTFTDIIVKSGNALLTIINDILDFSKIDAGQLTLDPAPFRLAEAIEDVATLVSARAQDKDIELIVRVAPDLPEYIIGDVGRLRQIVTNLMGNAIKFTEKGHVLVDVSGTVDLTTTTAQINFKITDTGIGIPADKLNQVFEKFSQVDTSATRRHEGTGLGLAISTKLVALMGGEIGATSIQGEGSTFWFSITVPIHGPSERKKVLPFDVNGARVLIIDDNPVNRAILLEQMQSWRFDACAATNGAEGLKVLHGAKTLGLDVDLLILDYHMPELNGAAVARIIRETPSLRDMPIILLTSVDTAMQSVEFDGVTIDAHLMKPARSSLLFDTIVSVIREMRSRQHENGIIAAPKNLMELGERMAAENKAVTASAPALPVPVPVPAPAAPAPIVQTIDILVAEDNPVNQIVFTQILEGLTHSFEIAANGRIAIEIMKAKRPTIILMDVSMPEMNGMEATVAIREFEKANNLSRTPIIGVTAHALKGDRENCIESGMDDYLSKPISPDMLEAKIRAHMAGSKSTRKA